MLNTLGARGEWGERRQRRADPSRSVQTAAALVAATLSSTRARRRRARRRCVRRQRNCRRRGARRIPRRGHRAERRALLHTVVHRRRPRRRGGDRLLEVALLLLRVELLLRGERVSPALCTPPVLLHALPVRLLLLLLVEGVHAATTADSEREDAQGADTPFHTKLSRGVVIRS